MLLYISYSTPECRLHMYVSRAARRLVVLCFSSAVSWVMSTYTVQPVTNPVIPPHPTWHGVVVDNERWTESEVVSSWVVSVLLMCCWCVGVRWRGGNTTLAYWVASVDHQSWPVYCWQSVSLHWASTETWGLLHAYTDIQYTAVCLFVCLSVCLSVGVQCIALPSLSLCVCVVQSIGLAQCWLCICDVRWHCHLSSLKLFHSFCQDVLVLLCVPLSSDLLVLLRAVGAIQCVHGQKLVTSSRTW